jgi:putative ABC transport system ATP-binding protein
LASVISLRQVCRIYQVGGQTIRALDHVDLDISKGEFVAVMGRSGSGKSTLLNMLGCMDRPDTGSYFLDEQKVSSMDDDSLSRIRNRLMGFIFQSFHLLPRKSALENVLLPRLFHEDGLREVDHERALDLLHQVGLEDRASHKPNELSGGQRQRVAIARALINKPRVILADEPTGNLDSKTSNSIMRLLQDLNRSGQTIVMVTHEAAVADFASRRIEMQDGKISAQHGQV